MGFSPFAGDKIVDQQIASHLEVFMDADPCINFQFASLKCTDRAVGMGGMGI